MCAYARLFVLLLEGGHELFVFLLELGGLLVDWRGRGEFLPLRFRDRCVWTFNGVLHLPMHVLWFHIGPDDLPQGGSGGEEPIRGAVGPGVRAGSLEVSGVVHSPQHAGVHFNCAEVVESVHRNGFECIHCLAAMRKLEIPGECGGLQTEFLLEFLHTLGRVDLELEEGGWGLYEDLHDLGHQRGCRLDSGEWCDLDLFLWWARLSWGSLSTPLSLPCCLILSASGYS